MRSWSTSERASYNASANSSASRLGPPSHTLAGRPGESKIKCSTKVNEKIAIFREVLWLLPGPPCLGSTDRLNVTKLAMLWLWAYNRSLGLLVSASWDELPERDRKRARRIPTSKINKSWYGPWHGMDWVFSNKSAYFLEKYSMHCRDWNMKQGSNIGPILLKFSYSHIQRSDVIVVFRLVT